MAQPSCGIPLFFLVGHEIQSQDAKVAFLIAFKAATCLFLSWRGPSVIRFPEGPRYERITTAALEATFLMIEIKTK